MEKTKLEALIAFFNSFTEKLKLEECKSLPDVTCLLHSVANFITIGRLSYANHLHYGYRQLTDFLRNQTDECLFETLNPDLAEREDDYEMSKILVLLLYELQHKREIEYKQCIASLSHHNRVEVVGMISHLNDRASWSETESWPAVLKTLSDFSNTSTDDESASIISSQVFFSGQVSNRASVCSSNKRTIAEFKVSSTDIDLRRKSDCVKLVHMENSINETKEQLKNIGTELDERTAECKGLREIIDTLKETRDSHTRRIAALQLENENMKPLQDDVEELKSLNTKAKIEQRRLISQVESYKRRCDHLAFEQGKYEKQLERLEKERDAALEDLKKRQQELSDEVEDHNDTRRKFVALRDESAKSEEEWKNRLATMELDILNKESFFDHRLRHGKDELVSERDSFYELKLTYVKRIEELESELAKYKEDQATGAQLSLPEESQAEQSYEDGLCQIESYKNRVNELEDQIAQMIGKDEILQRNTNAVVGIKNELAKHFGSRKKQIEQQPSRSWISIGTILLILFCLGSILVLLHDPPIFSEGLILVPWQWSIFSAT